MRSRIHPLGERAKGNSYGVTVGAYVVGSIIGGLALGVVGASLGRAVAAVVDVVGSRSGSVWGISDGRLVVAASCSALACAVGAVLDAGDRRLWCWRRQVDERWLDEFRGWVYGAGYGVQLGAAVMTIITSAATWAVIAATVVAPTWWAGVGVGGVFGLARGLSILPAASIHDPAGLVAHHRRFEGAQARSKGLTVAVLAALAVAFAAVAVVVAFGGGR